MSTFFSLSLSLVCCFTFLSLRWRAGLALRSLPSVSWAPAVTPVATYSSATVIKDIGLSTYSLPDRCCPCGGNHTFFCFNFWILYSLYLFICIYPLVTTHLTFKLVIVCNRENSSPPATTYLDSEVCITCEGR